MNARPNIVFIDTAVAGRSGSAALGGDWVREAANRNIEANLPFSGTALRDFSAVLARSTTLGNLSTTPSATLVSPTWGQSFTANAAIHPEFF